MSSQQTGPKGAVGSQQAVKGVGAPGQRWGGPATGVGSTSAFVYAQTIMAGTYECINNINSTVSGPMTNPNFPTYGMTYFNLGVDGTCITQVINTSSNLVASASPGLWNHSTSTPSGGLSTSGNLFTSTVGEIFLPVASSTSANTWILPNGTTFSPGTFFTGQQEYQILEQPGPWPAGSAVNTSVNVGTEMIPVFADLGYILAAQGATDLESFTNNWQVDPGL